MDEHIVRPGFQIDESQSTVHIVRNLSVKLTLLDSDDHQVLRTFFQTGDDQEIVLQRVSEAGSR